MTTGSTSSVQTNATFTLNKFKRVFSGDEFLEVLWATIFQTACGTIGAVLIRIFTALLLIKSFKGQGILRDLYPCSYEPPNIAVAFAVSTIGAGLAVAVVVFACVLSFSPSFLKCERGIECLRHPIHGGFAPALRAPPELFEPGERGTDVAILRYGHISAPMC